MKKLKEADLFGEYQDDNGYVHTVPRSLGFTNNGNLYTSWAAYLLLRSSENYGDIAAWWRGVIGQGEVFSETGDPSHFGLFARGPGASIPNQHDDYRGIAFGSFFCDGGMTARRILHFAENHSWFMDDQLYLGGSVSIPRLFKSWLFRHQDLVGLVEMAAGKKPGLLRQILLPLYLRIMARAGQLDQGPWMFGYQIAKIYELQPVWRSRFMTFAVIHFLSRMRIVWGRYSDGGCLAEVFDKYTKDKNCPFSSSSNWMVTSVVFRRHWLNKF